jgi:putative salt-induced outer membrane protein
MKALLCLAILFLAVSTRADFSNSSEANIIVTGGNSQLETYNLNTTNKYKLSEKNNLTLAGHYTYGTSSDLESARNWDASLRYDRELNAKWSAFFGEQLEGDKFSGVKTRFNTDLGAKHSLYKSEKSVINAEAGYRYTVERLEGGLPTDQQQKARLYTEGTRKFKEGIEGKLWVEYIPNFSEGTDWLMNIEPSLSIILSKTFSLKLAYKGQYDNLPTAGNKKYDYTYTTGLLANF